jgi:hypothetical protein
MPHARLLGAASGLALAAVLFLYLYANNLAPPLGDMWYHVLRGLDGGEDPFSYWWRIYLKGNPRIGESLDGLIGVGPVHLLVTQALSLAVLLLTAASVVLLATRRDVVASRWLLVAFVFISFLTLSSRDLGQILFYPPRTANYAFGYGLVLAFLLPYAAAARRGDLCMPWPFTLVMIPLGILAGLTNEHTIPSHIAALALALGVATWRRRPQIGWLWAYAGVVALVVGYLLLFFAPGQSRRYDGIKYQAFADGIPGLVVRCLDALSLFFAASWPIWLLNGVLLGLLFVAARLSPRGRRAPMLTSSETLIVAYAIATALAMAATVGASPIIKDSLFFASGVNATLVACVLALRLVMVQPTLAGVSVLILALLLNIRFWSVAVDVYSALHEQFGKRLEIIAESKARNELDVTVPRYEIDKRYKGFYRGDGLTSRVDDSTNVFAARYFGLKSIVIPQNQNQRREGQEVPKEG